MASSHLIASRTRNSRTHQADLLTANADRRKIPGFEESPIRFWSPRCIYHEHGAILLLMAAIATFALWLLGFAGTTRGTARHFQADTIRDRAVLSMVHPGNELWKNPKCIFALEELNKAMEHLKRPVVQGISICLNRLESRGSSRFGWQRRRVGHR